MTSLNDQLLAAHARHDTCALVSLYAQAAEGVERDAACFFLTHAYIYALDCGDARADALFARLKAEGRV